MKKVVFLTIFLCFLELLSTGRLQYYGVDAKLFEDGRAKVSMTLSFAEPSKSFRFMIPATIENFEVYPTDRVFCKVRSVGITYVECELNLTAEKRTIEIRFCTRDLVKRLKDKYYFDADLGLKAGVDSVFVSVTLPEGMGLVEGVEEKISMPEKASIVSDGRHIIVTWNLDDVSATDILRFKILYEKVREERNYFVYGIAFGVMSVGVITLIYLRKLKKSEKLVLSVLDEYERRVIEIVRKYGGKINQKKVVEETNLSKAKVSRVVKSLAERGLLEVERRGRTNILKLVKKKLEI